MRDTVWYVPQVPNQNEGKAVHFALESAANNDYVFVNHMHDWPQEIVYHFVNDDSLNITLGGPDSKDSGSWHEEYWYLLRE